jgi:hypothetical protein
MKSAPKGWIVFVVFVVVGFCFFWQPVFRGYFLGDDWWLINDHDWNKLPRYFSGNWTDGSQGTGGFYRPLVRTSFLADSTLYGLNPLGYHVENLLLHVVNAFLVSRLAAALLGNNVFGLIAGLLFLVFPQSHEPVSWIAARTALLATCFILLSTNLYVLYMRFQRRRLYLLSLLAYVFGLLSQESALLVPLFLLVYFLSRGRESFRRFALRRAAIHIAPFLAIAMIYVLVRHASLGFWIGGYGMETRALSPDRAYQTLCNYLFRLAFPSKATIDPLRIESLIFHWSTLSAIGMTVVLLLLVPRMPAVRCVVLWLIISILPFLSYPHLARFYYLPAAMFCLLLTSLFARLAPDLISAKNARIAFIALSSAALFIYYSVVLEYFNQNSTAASAKVRTFVSNAGRIIGDPSRPRNYFLFQNSMELVNANPLTHYRGAALLHYDFPAIAVARLYKYSNPNVHAYWGIPPAFKDFENAEALKVRTDFSLERYRIAGEKTYSWDFNLRGQRWRAKNDVLPLRSRFAYPSYMITADFPYLQSPPINYAEPLFATVEFDLRVERMKQKKVGTWILLAHDEKKQPREFRFSLPFDPVSRRFKRYVVQLGAYPNLDALCFNPTFGRFVVFEIRTVELRAYKLERAQD